MLEIKVNDAQIRRLKAALADRANKLASEIAIAVNATAKKVRSEMSKDVRQELATTAKAVNETLSQPRRASKGSPGATVRLAKTKRIALRDFGARQTRKGVTYKISKTAGRKVVPGAFMVDKLGKHVFKRKGKRGLPIRKLMGVSPWGIYTKRNMRPETVKMAEAYLRNQIERRIRFQLLKSGGKL